MANKKLVSIHLAENLLFHSIPYKTKDMKIRELCERIYELLKRTVSPSGRTLVQILGEVNETHHRYLFESIYKFISQQYLQSLSPDFQENRKMYIIEENNEFFLSKYESLQEILLLFKLQENYKEIPHYLKKRLSKKMLRSLYEDIPQLRILYVHRKNAPSFQRNVIKSLELKDKHLDRKKFPRYIKTIYIHHIANFQGHDMTVWEIVPSRITAPTPVCFIPGFGFNYNIFHLEGNESLDFEVAKNGSRVFVLDHAWEEQDASIDIYAEYLLTTMVDFVKRRTGSPQVILGGHGLGGTMIIFKQILNVMNYPRFITSVKAIILINSPISFNVSTTILSWLMKFSVLIFNTISTYETLPIKKFSRMVSLIPSLPFWMSINVPFTKNLPLLPASHSPATSSSATLNPFTRNHKRLKRLLKYSMVNPPRSVIKHILKMINADTPGAFSYNFEEIYVKPGENIYEFEKKWEEDELTQKQTIGIHYTENLYRIPNSIPILAIQSESNPLFSADSFFEYWQELPSAYKTILRSNPHDPQNEEEVQENIRNFARSFGQSIAIGIKVEGDLHIDSLISQKKAICCFIEEIDQFIFDPIALCASQMESYHHLIERIPHPESQETLTKDFANKIRFLDISFFRPNAKKMITLLLDVILNYHPPQFMEKAYQDLMLKDLYLQEDHQEYAGNVFFCCIRCIISFEQEPEFIIQNILHLLHTRSIEYIHPAGFRTLLELAVALFDHRTIDFQELSPEFLESFDELLQLAVSQTEPSVVLHAIRAYLHTRDEVFIRKGMEHCIKLPKEWKLRAYKIYWNEIEKLIHDMENEENLALFAQMDTLMSFYEQAGTEL